MQLTYRDRTLLLILLVLLPLLLILYAPRGLTAQPIIVHVAVPCNDPNAEACMSRGPYNVTGFDLIELRDNMPKAAEPCAISHEMKHWRDPFWHHDARSLPGILTIDCGDGTIYADFPRPWWR